RRESVITMSKARRSRCDCITVPFRVAQFLVAVESWFVSTSMNWIIFVIPIRGDSEFLLIDSRRLGWRSFRGYGPGGGAFWTKIDALDLLRSRFQPIENQPASS